MKKILGIIILGLILNGCASGAPSNYSGYKDYWKQQGVNYAGMACPISSIEKGNTTGCWWLAANSQSEANQGALNSCSNNSSDCVIFKEGNRTVYNADDVKKVQLASIVEETKNTCKTLGFKQGTDKFSDCALKLYTQKIELAKKENQQVVLQNQGSSTVRVIDITREREDTMRRSMGLINGTCTLATYYSC